MSIACGPDSRRFARVVLASALFLALPAPSRADSDMRHCGDVVEGPSGADAPDVSDIVKTLRIVVGLDAPTLAEASRADVAPTTSVATWRGAAVVEAAGDGQVNVNDVVGVLRAAVGLQRGLGCFRMPIIQGVLPTRICSGPGHPVQVIGWNLVDESSADPADDLHATIGGMPATVISWDAGSITLATPDLSALGAGAPVDLVLDDVHGLALDAGAWSILGPCAAPPDPQRMTPSDDSRCATQLEIQGLSLTCVTSARLEGTRTGRVISLDGLVVRSDMSLTASIPAWIDPTDTMTDLVLECPGSSARLENAFGFTNPPRPHVESITPASGSAVGGESVTLQGTGFDCLRAIDVGSSTVLPGPGGFIVTATGDILVPEMPAAASPYFDSEASVVARDAQGVVDASPPVFHYLGVGLPECTRVTPTSGPIAGGTLVTISGASLALVSRVGFGALSAGSVLHPNGSTVVVTAPPASTSGPVTITLANPDGLTCTCPTSFVYEP